MNSSRIVGSDVSLNHAAFVLLVKGKIEGYRYVTDRKKVAAKSSDLGTYLSAAKIKDKQERDLLRLVFWNIYIAKLLSLWKPDLIVLEDYAYRAPQTAYQLGEVGGAARYYSWRSNARLRLHDPMTLKMFAVHDGGADARETMLSILARWKATHAFKRFIEGQDQRTCEDLCDAYALAQLGSYELQLRDGTLAMKSLHAKEIQVFNRTTKRYPVNVLSRDFLCRVNENS